MTCLSTLKSNHPGVYGGGTLHTHPNTSTLARAHKLTYTLFVAEIGVCLMPDKKMSLPNRSFTKERKITQHSKVHRNIGPRLSLSWWKLIAPLLRQSSPLCVYYFPFPVDSVLLFFTFFSLPLPPFLDLYLSLSMATLSPLFPLPLCSSFLK